MRREMIQTSINCIQKRLESNEVEEILQKFLSGSSAKELQEPLRSLAGHIPSLDLQQASHEAYELDRLPVDLLHLSANKEVPMMSYIASVLLVVTPDSMRVERLVSLYNDVNTIRRSGLNEESINDRLAIAFKSSGTANWDPQPAVAKFLTMKDRRQTAPDIKTYKKREFVRKFFE